MREKQEQHLPSLKGGRPKGEKAKSVTAILLAAGSSRRMGAQNKLLLAWRGEPMLLRVARALEGSGVGEPVVVLGHEAELVRELLEGLRVRFVYNPEHLRGMTSSIQAGIRASSEVLGGWMICLGDMPWLRSEDYARLLEKVSGRREILVPVYEGRRGHPVFFSRHFREELLAHTEPEGLRAVVKRYERECVREVAFSSDRILRDVDRPEDLAP